MGGVPPLLSISSSTKPISAGYAAFFNLPPYTRFSYNSKYKRRRDIMLNALYKYFGKIDVSGLNAGSHLVWRVPSDMRPAHKLVDLFKKKQVAISTLEQFDTTSCNKISRLSDLAFLGFSAVDDNRIEEGVKLMSNALNRALS